MQARVWTHSQGTTTYGQEKRAVDQRSMLWQYRKRQLMIGRTYVATLVNRAYVA